MSDQYASDVLVIGSGIAGLSLALRLADDLDVTVVNKSRFPESNSYYAQGGMAAVLGEEDSVDSHVHDTVDAGAGLCHPAIVRLVAERGPACVDWLCAQGVRFTPADGRRTTSPYHLTREGGHSQRRVHGLARRQPLSQQRAARVHGVRRVGEREPACPYGRLAGTAKPRRVG